MSAHLTISAIVLTVALAMILNAHIIVARSISPSEMLDDLEGEQLAKKLADEYKHFIEEKYQPYVKQIEQSLPSSGLIENYEKPIKNIKELNNNLNEPVEAVEEDPEPLPNPQALVNSEKGAVYKKHGSSYHMTICHFKICNMGRKRDTHNQLY